ncbi:MAG: recombinase family protein, partial [Eubacteriales bacterium]|nr:recombinase family protein [Eubacteriales bacterium]
LYAEGTGCSEIARHLNAKGYAAPSGREGAKWCPATVGRMLSNCVYIGDTVQGISEKLSFKSKKTRRLPEAEWVITENTHKAIISRELFEKADAIRRLNSRKTGGHRGNVHPFRGLLYCGGCGSLMLARKREGRPMSYICGAYAKSGRQSCSSHHVREDELLSLVENKLMEILNDKNVVKKASELLSKSCEELNGVRGAGGLKTELAEKKRQQDLLYKDRLEGNISEELFFRTNCSLEKLITDIQKRIKEFISESRLEPDKLIDCIRSDISAVIPENRLIKTLVKRILIYEGEDVSDKLDNIPEEGIIIAEMNYKK